jgi:hypothetical protein
MVDKEAARAVEVELVEAPHGARVARLEDREGGLEYGADQRGLLPSDRAAVRQYQT